MPGIFKKISYAAVAGIVAVTGGLAHFKFSSPSSSPRKAVAQQVKPDLLNGAILIPAGDGVCEMHGLDNVTGRIMDYGVVNCSDASNQSLYAWRQAMNKDRFVEVGKSLRQQPER